MGSHEIVTMKDSVKTSIKGTAQTPEAEAIPVKADKEIDEKWDKSAQDIQNTIEGIDMAAGIANTGSEDLFYSLLGDFYLMIDMKIKKIQRCIAENQIKDYTVEVHALKSSARLIGATELGDEFYQLELLGNAEDRESIERQTPGVLEHLRSYKQILAQYAENAEDDKMDTDVSAMTALLQDMVSAIDSFDLDKADVTMKHLDNYKFPEDCLEELENLRVYVADVAMEDIMSTCKSLEAKLAGDKNIKKEENNNG